LKNILVAIDFSDVTNKTIETAAEIALSFSSKLWLIHVAAPDPEFIGYETGPQTERNWRAETLRKEHRDIQAKASELESKGINVTSLLIQGDTAEAILAQANKLQADLIVIGSHGRSALYKTLVGSVSEGVIRQSSCPVLLVPAKNNES
jgi:nucleotide-binding universal stress UspA family protein